MAIQVRRGHISDLDKSKLLPGEWACAMDNKRVFMQFGTTEESVKEMPTKEEYEELLSDVVESANGASEAAQMAIEATEKAGKVTDTMETLLQNEATIREEISKAKDSVEKNTVIVTQKAEEAEKSALDAENAADRAEEAASNLENVKLQAEATTELMGAVKYDGTTIKKNDSGQLTVGDIEEKGIKFKLPVSLSNIVSGESLAVLFGKIHNYINATIESFNSQSDEIGLLQEKCSGLETNKIDYDDTVDDLISTSSVRPLSANMGRELAERIDSLNTDFTNNFTVESIPITDIITIDENIVSYDSWPAIARRMGKLISLNFKLTFLVDNPDNPIATIAEGYRPSGIVYIANGYPGFISGNQIRGWASKGDTYYISVMYFIE